LSLLSVSGPPAGRKVTTRVAGNPPLRWRRPAKESATLGRASSPSPCSPHPPRFPTNCQRKTRENPTIHLHVLLFWSCSGSPGLTPAQTSRLDRAIDLELQVECSPPSAVAKIPGYEHKSRTCSRQSIACWIIIVQMALFVVRIQTRSGTEDRLVSADSRDIAMEMVASLGEVVVSAEEKSPPEPTSSADSPVKAISPSNLQPDRSHMEAVEAPSVPASSTNIESRFRVELRTNSDGRYIRTYLMASSRADAESSVRRMYPVLEYELLKVSRADIEPSYADDQNKIRRALDAVGEGEHPKGSAANVQDGQCVYAGFWRRAVAIVIDWILNFVVMFLFAFLLVRFIVAEGSMDLANDDDYRWYTGVMYTTSILAWWMYFAGMESSRLQGTLGKCAIGIRVTDLTGNRIGFGRATARHFGKIPSALIFGIGFLMAAFTPKKQALHDMMAGCLVVKRSRD